MATYVLLCILLSKFIDRFYSQEMWNPDCKERITTMIQDKIDRFSDVDLIKYFMEDEE